VTVDSRGALNQIILSELVVKSVVPARYTQDTHKKHTNKVVLYSQMQQTRTPCSIRAVVLFVFCYQNISSQ